MAKKLKKVPTHRSEEREREFWAKADSTDYVDWSGARPLVLPDLKPTLKTISLRLPEHLLVAGKELGHRESSQLIEVSLTVVH